MKLRKRLLTFIFAALLLMYVVITSASAEEVSATHPFTDIGEEYSSWATASLNKMYEKKIIRGVSDTEFDPEGKFTREMMVTMFWRLEGSESNGATPTQLAGIFTDGASVSDYAREAVMWAYTNNVVSGYPEGDFRPQNVVTRQEAAKFIVNYAQYAGITLPNISDRVLADTPDPWAYDAVYACVRAGIITGDENGYFRPNDETWRIHAAHLMAKLPEKPKPVSTDKNDPNPDKIGYASYGDLVLADGFSLSKTLLVTDGNSKNQFTTTTLGNHGWHETRIVRNEYGTYVVFAQDEALDKEGTYSGQYTYATVKTKFYLVKVSDNGFKKVLEGYYPSSWSGSAQVNVLCGNDGLLYVTAFGIDPQTYFASDLARYAAYLNVYEFDTKTDSLLHKTEDVIPMVYDNEYFANAPSMNAGYYQPMLDNENGKLYCLFAAGGARGRGYISWFNYDLSTHKWEDKNYLAKVPTETVDGKACNPMRIEYFNLYPDGNGGLYGVAQRTTSTQEMKDYYADRGYDIPFNTTYSFTWDALYLFTIPDMTKEEIFVNHVIVEPDYTNRIKFPINQAGYVQTASSSHYEGGTTYLRSNGDLYVLYKEYTGTQKLVVFDTTDNYKVVKSATDLSLYNKVLSNTRYQFAFSESLFGDMYLIAVNTQTGAELEAYKVTVNSKKVTLESLIKDKDGKTAALPLTIGNTTTALTQGRMQYTTTRGHSIQDGVMSIITSGPSLQNSRLTSMSGVTKKYDAMGWSTGSETYPLYYYSIKLPE